MIPRYSNGQNAINRLRQEMDEVFGEFLGDYAGLDPRRWLGGRAYPPVNIWEDGQAVYAEAELPGLKMKDLEVLVMGRELTIKGAGPTEEKSDVIFHRRERGTGAFSRVIHLPVEIEAERVEASIKDGVLTIRMPKAEAARARKIEVRQLDQ